MSERSIATVVMLDVVGSTAIAAQLGDVRYRELSARFARSVREGLKRSGGREEDNAGDGFFASFPQPDRAIGFATTLADEVQALGIEIRSGIHTGQTERLDGKAQGIAVVIGARVMSLAGPGEVLVTSTTKELVTGSDFGFEDFSAHELKGVPGTWQVFAVTSIDGEPRSAPLPAEEAAARLGRVRPPASRGSRRPAIIAGTLTGLVTIAAVAYAVTREGPNPSAPPRDEPVALSEVVVQVDQTGKILASIPAPVPTVSVPGVSLPTSAHSMVVGQGSVWTVRFRNLLQIDPERSEVEENLTLEQGISFSVNLTEGADKIWIAYDGGLDELNPATGEQQEAFRLETGQARSNDVAFGGGFVWLGASDGRLFRFDPRTDRKVERDGLDPIDAIAFGHGSVWTADVVGGTVSRYDPDTMRSVAEIDLAADYLISGDVSVWTLSVSAGTLSRIDPATDEVLGAPVQVGPNPSGLAAGAGAIWVGDEDGIIRRVDEDTRKVTEIPFGAPVRALAVDHETDTLWVDVV